MSENEYLEQVMAKQQRVEVDLKARRAPPAAHRMVAGYPPAAAEPPQALEVARPSRGRGSSPSIAVPEPEPRPEITGPAVDVRITGWWRWKTVVVPPNAHVVHTRRGHARPLHIGLGMSFRYDPARDSFLVVPGTMQTIMINAYCICRELQGLLVQGYVARLIEALPLVAEKLPRPSELKAISIGGAGGDGGALAALVAQLLAVVEGFRGPCEPRKLA